MFCYPPHTLRGLFHYHFLIHYGGEVVYISRILPVLEFVLIGIFLFDGVSQLFVLDVVTSLYCYLQLSQLHFDVVQHLLGF